MFDDLIINDSFDIFKFLNKLNLDLFYTKPQFRHLVAFALAKVLKGFNGKVSDANEINSEKHRTTISRFLNKSSWNKSLLLEEMKKYAIKRIWQLSKDTHQPIYIIMDDTVNEKTVPSSKAQNTIEGIKRYMRLLMLTYLYCELEVQDESLGFSKGLKRVEISHKYFF